MVQTYGVSTAIYCRLSRDDGNEESQSILSQKEILEKYVKEQGWKVFDIYIDDGYSGTNFERPSFQRLLNDIEMKKINIVVTKDLSRLGRNYIQTGFYTEEYFPNHNVRYIALNDNFDTSIDNNNDFMPFKNIINEWYAKDISKKIRFTLDNKAKNGEARNTVFPIFGYMYNENYERIPDPETSRIVKKIFDLYLKLNSSVEVAKVLRKDKVKLPCYYNAIKYNYNKKKVFNMSEEELYNWTPSMIRKIIKNDAYLGNYTTSKTRSISFKNKKRYINQNKYVFENRYEAIIDKDTWEATNRFLTRTRASKTPNEKDPLAGLIYCACCGHKLVYDRSKSKNGKSYTYRYYCRNKKCSKGRPFILRNMMVDIVKKQVLNLKRYILENESSFLKFASNYHHNKNFVSSDVSSSILQYQTNIEKIDSKIELLFEQYAENKIALSTYEKINDKYNKEKKMLEKQLEELTRISGQNKSNELLSYDANRLVELLKNIEDEEIMDINFLRALIYIIEILVEKDPETKGKQYYIKFTFTRFDEGIKEFISNGESCSNLC